MADEKNTDIGDGPAHVAQVAREAGAWIDDAFGTGMRHLGEAFADSMAAFRIRNRMRAIAKTQKVIAAAGLTGQIRPLPDRLAIQILEAIEIETDESLQDVWAAFIANSVDPTKPAPDRLLIDVIRKLEPFDWPLLRRLFVAEPRTYEAAELEMSIVDLEVSMDRFAALGLFAYEKSAYIVGTHHRKEVLIIKIDRAGYFANRLLGVLANATRSNWEGT